MEKSIKHHVKDYQWWKPIEITLADVKLKGLNVICPECNEKGLIITRWIKGPALKPIYILHIKEKKVRNVCELNSEQSSSIRGTIKIYEADIKKLIESRKTFILFSGGKDSLATLVYLKDMAKNLNSNLTAIYVDTTAGLPESMSYVEKVCDYLKVYLEVVRPKVDYFTLVKKWGIPSFKYRWCCRELKIKPIENYLKNIKEPKVVFDGIRAAESNIRKQYIPIWYHPGFKCLSVSPIFNWSDNKVISFINSNGLPKTVLHSLGTSTECCCGAYKTEEDFRKLYDLNREMFHKLVNVEEQNKNGYTFIYKDGQKIPLKDLGEKLKRDKEL